MQTIYHSILYLQKQEEWIAIALHVDKRPSVVVVDVVLDFRVVLHSPVDLSVKWFNHAKLYHIARIECEWVYANAAVVVLPIELKSHHLRFHQSRSFKNNKWWP